MATNNSMDLNNNPFFLHPNENPALILVSPSLNSKNYHSWARSMKLALQSKNKLQFVNGSLPQPLPEDPSFNSWIRYNTMVLSWIQRSVEDSILKSILWMDDASMVWRDLQDRFSQADIFRVAELQEEFYSLHQGNHSVSEFFTQLKVLWEEIENYRPMKLCKCSTSCSCGMKVSVNCSCGAMES